jgi:hypothetical protein
VGYVRFAELPVAVVAMSVIRAAIAAASFDHLVGALLKKPRYVEAECLGSLEVDEELEFGR